MNDMWNPEDHPEGRFENTDIVGFGDLLAVGSDHGFAVLNYDGEVVEERDDVAGRPGMPYIDEEEEEYWLPVADPDGGVHIVNLETIDVEVPDASYSVDTGTGILGDEVLLETNVDAESYEWKLSLDGETIASEEDTTEWDTTEAIAEYLGGEPVEELQLQAELTVGNEAGEDTETKSFSLTGLDHGIEGPTEFEYEGETFTGEYSAAIDNSLFETSLLDGNDIIWTLDGEETMQTATGRTVSFDFTDAGEYSLTQEIELDGLVYSDEKEVKVEASEDQPPVVTGDNRPRDLDEDGLYEDIDGDGELTISDVQKFFQEKDSGAVQNNPQYFNFDGNEPADVSIGDVQALFQYFTEQ